MSVLTSNQPQNKFKALFKKDVATFRISEQKKAQPETKTGQSQKKIQSAGTRTNQKVAHTEDNVVPLRIFEQRQPATTTKPLIDIA